MPGDRSHFLTAPPDGHLEAALASVVEELRRQYALGFAPRHRDGNVGRIDVRVARPGATVSARASYRAPASTR